MTYYFDSIKVEVCNSTWVDITADVMTNPHPKWNRAIMSNKPRDRVGNQGTFTFTLRNSDNCLGRVAGYYSPGHASCWAGWTTGLPVRLSFTFEGVQYYKYYGVIRPDGIKVAPGIYGPRTVDVTCGDFMYRSSVHELRSLSYGVNQTFDQLVAAVNANMPIQPLNTSYDVGIETFPGIFDVTYDKTTALGEYNKGALSELAYVYPIGNRTDGETLRVENRGTRYTASVMNISMPTIECGKLLDEGGDHILNEDGSFIVLDDQQAASFSGRISDGMDVGYGDNLMNRVGSTVYPRTLDATNTVVLFSLSQRMEIKPLETVTDFVATYRDPNSKATHVSAVDWVAPVSGTDYNATANSDGTGADLSAYLSGTRVNGTESTIFTMTNTHTTLSIWVYIQVRGKGAYTYNSIQNVRNDPVSQQTNGVFAQSFDFKYLVDGRKAQLYSDYLLNRYSTARNAINACPMWANRDGMTMLGFLQMEPGSKATFAETQTGVSGDYFINGYTAEIVDGKYVKWNPVLSDDTGYVTIYNRNDPTDTHLNSTFPTTNYGASTVFQVGVLSGNTFNGLLKFDISTIPPAAIIVSAQLSLTIDFWSSGSGTRTMSLYRCLRVWTGAGATWNKYDGVNAWGTAGAENTTTDRENVAIGTVTLDSAKPIYTTIPIILDSAKVQEWVSGSVANNGMVLKMGAGTDFLLSFESSECVISNSYRPRLIIIYR